MSVCPQNTSLVTHAHIAMPCDAFPLVAELVRRLGGDIVPTHDTSEHTIDTIIRPPMPERERIGRMLKGLRLRAGFTQKALAKAIDVPQGHISEYENHKRPIPSHKVALLAKILNTVESHFTAIEPMA